MLVLTTLSFHFQAIVTPTTIYCPGQIRRTPDGRILNLAECYQFGDDGALKYLCAVLMTAGGVIEKAITVNVFLIAKDNFAEWNSVNRIMPAGHISKLTL